MPPREIPSDWIDYNSHVSARWHAGIGLSFYATGLDRGKFISVGGVPILAAQVTYMLENKY